MLLNECWSTYVSCCVVLGNTGRVSVGFLTKTLLIRFKRRVNLDLPQVDLMSFRVEYVRPRSGHEGLFRKSSVNSE